MGWFEVDRDLSFEDIDFGLQEALSPNRLLSISLEEFFFFLFPLNKYTRI